MRGCCLMMLATIALGPNAEAQDNAPNSKVSRDPLTAEQIAVYRAVLKDYLKDSGGWLIVANKTGSIGPSGPFLDPACMKGLELKSAANSVHVLHQITPTDALNPSIVLVDPEQQGEKSKENDLQEVLKRAIDACEEISEKQVDESVKKTFLAGLFTLSEIVFDKQHRRAVVPYSFMCGAVCGHGKTLILARVGDEWKVSKACGGWSMRPLGDHPPSD